MSNFIIFLISSLILYGLFRFFLFLVKYFIFQKVVNAILDQVFEDSQKKIKKEDIQLKPQSYTEDELLGEKNKVKEQQRQEEMFKNINVERLDDEPSQEEGVNEKKIVGVNIKVYGKWTQKIAESMLAKLQNLDVNILKNKGYFQAMEAARSGQRSVSQSSGKGGGGRGLG